MTIHALGIDVGFAAVGRTTGLCLISINGDSLRWECLNTFTDRERRIGALKQLVPSGTDISGVAIDGPLVPRLLLTEHFRAADSLLSRGPFQQRGKPGQTSSPTGQKLHTHATLLANLVIELQREGQLTVTPATHPNAITTTRIVEAFPTAFLSVLLADDDFFSIGRNKSDVYWELAVQQGYINSLLQCLIPQVRLTQRLEDLKDHDHRAAFICALTALGVAKNQYVAVGDPNDGDIMLPTATHWGLDSNGHRWAEVALREKLNGVRANKKHPHHSAARVLCNGAPWIT